MSNETSFNQINYYIETTEINISESPLLQKDNITFKKDNIDLNDFCDNYKFLLTPVEIYSFDNIDFSKIDENQLMTLRSSFKAKNNYQKKLIVLFMLLIVLKQNNFFNIFDIDGVKYCMLFNTLFLPPNPLEKCPNHLVFYLNKFLIEVFKNNPDEVIEAIYQYIDKLKDVTCIYNFITFLINMLTNKDQELIQSFIKSNLFQKIIEISREELPIFDFYRNIVYKFPVISFQNSYVTQSMFFNFFDEVRNKSVIIIFEEAIQSLTDSTVILSEILIVFTHIISEASGKEPKESDLVLNMISCIDFFFAKISPKFDLSSFFKAAATFAVKSNNDLSFNLIIDSIRKMINQRPSFLFQLRKNNSFFEILSECKKKVDYEFLINFAKLTSGDMILLYQAICVLLCLIPNISEKEESIVSKLLELCESKGNIIELDNAKVPDFILDRLLIIQDKEEIRDIYIQLFSVITSEIFHKTVFYHTIELLKNPDFKYSCSLLEAINNQLNTFIQSNNLENHNYSSFHYRSNQLDLHNIPFAFYRFDNKSGCGIISPKVTLNRSFSFCFWIRINEMDIGTKKQPIPNDPDNYYDLNENTMVFLDNDNYKLDFYFKDQKIYVRYFKFVKGNQEVLVDSLLLDYKFEQGIWYFIDFMVKGNKMILEVFDYKNDNFKTNEKISISFHSGDYQLYIARKPVLNELEIDQPSIICDMSAFLLQNESMEASKTRKELVNFLSSKHFDLDCFPNLLYLFNPSQSQDNICFNINQNALQVSYSGRLVTICPNFCDVIQNITAINTFLPLIGCLKDKESTDKGTKNLFLILSILRNTINICEKSLLRVRFFELLVSFLYDCESLFNEEIFGVLFEMLPRIKNHELKKSILTSIYLNNDFYENLDDSFVSEYFSNSMEKTFESIENENKIVFDDLTTIIYSGVRHFNQESPISQFYWKYVAKLCLDSPNDTNVSFLIDIMCSYRSEFVAYNILKILYSIFQNKEDDISKYNEFTPYIITYSQYHDSIEILKLTIQIIEIVSIKTNIKDSNYSTIFHLMIVFRPSSNVLQESLESLIELVLKIILDEEMISFLPFLVILLQNSKLEELNQQICYNFSQSNSKVKDKITEMPFWTYWITKLCLQAYNPNYNERPREFADLCILCLKNSSSSLIELLNFFEIYNGIVVNSDENDYRNSKIDFTKVNEIILVYIIKNNPNPKMYYPYVYNFMLFSIQAVNDERKSSNLSYLGNFVTELFRNYDINISLKDHVDKELLDLLKSKTESLLNFQRKVQLCGGKIEVSYKEVNSYLKNILENNHNQNQTQNQIEENTDKFTSISTDVLTRCLPEYKNIVTNNLQNILKWSGDLINALKLKREYIEKTDAPIEQKLVYISDLEKYNYYYKEYSKIISEQETKLRNASEFLKKIKGSFMLNISKTPGPWENPNKNELKHFKMLNRVSKSGKKILMRLINNFNDHNDASINRYKAITINKVNKNVYKTLLAIPQKSNDLFTTKVLISSQSYEEEEAFLTASEEFITLQINSSNNFIYWEDIEFILNRKTAFVDCSCEIFKNNGRSYFIIFPENQRNLFYSYIDKLKLEFDLSNYENKFDFFRSLRFICQNIYQNKETKQILDEMKLTDLWLNRQITTYSYIYYLNLFSGKSFNDIHQYIVFPLIFTDTSEDNLLYNKIEQLRDFSKPVSALSESYIEQAITKYKDMCGCIPFLFGELPLSSIAVTFYMLRTEPYTTIHVTHDQQFGEFPKFDHPDRLFDSIKRLMEIILDFGSSKEFIPEFFSFPFFLTNENEFDLGVKSNEERVNNVELPKWTRNYYSFVSTMRLMLEGKVSDTMISKWIDLLFGVNRKVLNYKGHEYNLYKTYLYPENPDVNFKEEVIQCGSMPEQLFTEKHPSRKVIQPNIISINTQIQDKNFDPRNKAFFVKNILFSPSSLEAFMLRVPTKENPSSFVPLDLNSSAIYGKVLGFSKILSLIVFGTKNDPFLTVLNLNTRETKSICYIPFIITSVYIASGRFLVTGSKDCSIRVWNLQNIDKKKVNQISSSGFHTDIITSIGCCYDNGLLVSADKSSTLVFETMVDHVFINAVNLNEISNRLSQINTNRVVLNDDYETDRNDIDFTFDDELKNMFSSCSMKKDLLIDVKMYNKKRISREKKISVDDRNKPLNYDDKEIPIICIFKSGIVAVSRRSNVFLLDCRGKIVRILSYKHEVIEMKKSCLVDTREFLIIGVEPKSIYLFDVAQLTYAKIYKSYFTSITTFQKEAAFVTYYKGTVKTFEFNDIPQYVSCHRETPTSVTAYQ